MRRKTGAGSKSSSTSDVVGLSECLSHFWKYSMIRLVCLMCDTVAASDYLN